MFMLVPLIAATSNSMCQPFGGVLVCTWRTTGCTLGTLGFFEILRHLCWFDSCATPKGRASALLASRPGAGTTFGPIHNGGAAAHKMM